ncbi:unnamed protein product [Amoebophrya sp. A25]|nr:unnamed protein product [Amoebophrya sp. A25]|eukprot:GSA25T00024531001.1
MTGGGTDSSEQQPRCLGGSSEQCCLKGQRKHRSPTSKTAQFTKLLSRSALGKGRVRSSRSSFHRRSSISYPLLIAAQTFLATFVSYVPVTTSFTHRTESRPSFFDLFSQKRKAREKQTAAASRIKQNEASAQHYPSSPGKKEPKLTAHKKSGGLCLNTLPPCNRRQILENDRRFCNAERIQYCGHHLKQVQMDDLRAGSNTTESRYIPKRTEDARSPRRFATKSTTLTEIGADPDSSSEETTASPEAREEGGDLSHRIRPLVILVADKRNHVCGSERLEPYEDAKENREYVVQFNGPRLGLPHLNEGITCVGPPETGCPEVCYEVQMRSGECWGSEEVPVPGSEGEEALLTDFGCMGRCGTGCVGDDIAVQKCSNWGRDCLRYDVCSYMYDGQLYKENPLSDPNCADEYSLIFDDLRSGCSPYEDDVDIYSRDYCGLRPEHATHVCWQKQRAICSACSVIGDKQFFSGENRWRQKYGPRDPSEFTCYLSAGGSMEFEATNVGKDASDAALLGKTVGDRAEVLHGGISAAKKSSPGTNETGKKKDHMDQAAIPGRSAASSKKAGARKSKKGRRKPVSAEIIFNAEDPEDEEDPAKLEREKALAGETEVAESSESSAREWEAQSTDTSEGWVAGPGTDSPEAATMMDFPEAFAHLYRVQENHLRSSALGMCTKEDGKNRVTGSVSVQVRNANDPWEKREFCKRLKTAIRTAMEAFVDAAQLERGVQVQVDYCSFDSKPMKRIDGDIYTDYTVDGQASPPDVPPRPAFTAERAEHERPLLSESTGSDGTEMAQEVGEFAQLVYGKRGEAKKVKMASRVEEHQSSSKTSEEKASTSSRKTTRIKSNVHQHGTTTSSRKTSSTKMESHLQDDEHSTRDAEFNTRSTAANRRRGRFKKKRAHFFRANAEVQSHSQDQDSFRPRGTKSVNNKHRETPSTSFVQLVGSSSASSTAAASRTSQSTLSESDPSPVSAATSTFPASMAILNDDPVVGSGYCVEAKSLPTSKVVVSLSQVDRKRLFERHELDRNGLSQQDHDQEMLLQRHHAMEKRTENTRKHLHARSSGRSGQGDEQLPPKGNGGGGDEEFRPYTPGHLPGVEGGLIPPYQSDSSILNDQEISGVFGFQGDEQIRAQQEEGGTNAGALPSFGILEGDSVAGLDGLAARSISDGLDWYVDRRSPLTPTFQAYFRHADKKVKDPRDLRESQANAGATPRIGRTLDVDLCYRVTGFSSHAPAMRFGIDSERFVHCLDHHVRATVEGAVINSEVLPQGVAVDIHVYRHRHQAVLPDSVFGTTALQLGRVRPQLQAPDLPRITIAELLDSQGMLRPSWDTEALRAFWMSLAPGSVKPPHLVAKRDESNDMWGAGDASSGNYGAAGNAEEARASSGGTASKVGGSGQTDAPPQPEKVSKAFEFEVLVNGNAPNTPSLVSSSSTQKHHDQDQRHGVSPLSLVTLVESRVSARHNAKETAGGKRKTSSSAHHLHRHGISTLNRNSTSNSASSTSSSSKLLLPPVKDEFLVEHVVSGTSGREYCDRAFGERVDSNIRLLLLDCLQDTECQAVTINPSLTLGWKCASQRILDSEEEAAKQKKSQEGGSTAGGDEEDPDAASSDDDAEEEAMSLRIRNCDKYFLRYGELKRECALGYRIVHRDGLDNPREPTAEEMAKYVIKVNATIENAALAARKLTKKRLSTAAELEDAAAKAGDKEPEADTEVEEDIEDPPPDTSATEDEEISTSADANSTTASPTAATTSPPVSGGASLLLRVNEGTGFSLPRTKDEGAATKRPSGDVEHLRVRDATSSTSTGISSSLSMYNGEQDDHERDNNMKMMTSLELASAASSETEDGGRGVHYYRDRKRNSGRPSPVVGISRHRDENMEVISSATNSPTSNTTDGHDNDGDSTAPSAGGTASSKSPGSTGHATAGKGAGAANTTTIGNATISSGAGRTGPQGPGASNGTTQMATNTSEDSSSAAGDGSATSATATGANGGSSSDIASTVAAEVLAEDDESSTTDPYPAPTTSTPAPTLQSVPLPSPPTKEKLARLANLTPLQRLLSRWETLPLVDVLLEAKAATNRFYCEDEDLDFRRRYQDVRGLIRDCWEDDRCKGLFVNPDMTLGFQCHKRASCFTLPFSDRPKVCSTGWHSMRRVSVDEPEKLPYTLQRGPNDFAVKLKTSAQAFGAKYAFTVDPQR